MNLTFLCSSLEQGRDGVGDYVRRLASELLRQGHAVVAIALNDQYVTSLWSGMQKIDNTDVWVTRIPSSWSILHKYSKVYQLVETINPQWLSLHFVTYGFQKKGLPLSLSFFLKFLGQNRHWQVMFHELWINSDSKSTLQIKIIHKVQKYIIKKLLSDIKPSVIHTHLPEYYNAIKKLGWSVIPFPLFSNIAVSSLRNTNFQNSFKIVFFSQVDSHCFVINFLSTLQQELVKAGKSIEVLLLGSNEMRMQAFKISLEKIDGLQGSVHYTGFLDDLSLSSQLSHCDLGITSIPRHAIGKSSSVATLLAHGVPIAAPVISQGYEATYIVFFSQLQIASVVVEPNLRSIETASVAVCEARNEMLLSTLAEFFVKSLK